MNSANALQKGLFSALKSDPRLTPYVKHDQIFDLAPHPKAYPYLVLAKATVHPWGQEGDEHILTFEMYTKTMGRKEINDTFNTLDVVLGDLDAFDGYRIVLLQKKEASTSLSPQSAVLKGEITFRVLTENLC